MRHTSDKLNTVIAHALRLADLTERQSYAIARRMDGLKHREIALEMGVSRRMVSKFCAAGLRKIRERMPQFAGN